MLKFALFFFHSITRHWTVLIEACFAASHKQTFCVKCASEETELILNLLEINKEILKSANLEKERKQVFEADGKKAISQ